MVILPGIYHHLKLQQEDFKAYKLTKGDSFIYKILDHNQTAKDVKKYIINWVAQPYKKGDIYITIPYLPYRAKGPSIGTQQTILLQFISI